MFKRTYDKIKMGPERLVIVEQASNLITSYRNQGYKLTLRQLYYRFIADDLLPADWAELKPDGTRGTKNTQRNYKRLGDVISDGRMTGLLDWEGLEDRTRELVAVPHWESPAEIMQSAHNAFRVDKWTGQPIRVEVWVEKDALEGIVKQAANRWDCAAFSCRGYTSQSSMWEAARRLLGYLNAGQRPVILHLGDHDPSGIDMTRDIWKRLNDFIEMDWLHENMKVNSCGASEIRNHIEAFCREEHGEADVLEDLDNEFYFRPVRVKRIALTKAQVEQYDPPPNPAKTTDARYKKYEEEHGDESWELDALEPAVLSTLIDNEIRQLCDEDKYDARQETESTHRILLDTAAKHWDGGVSTAIMAVKSKLDAKANKKKGK